MKHKKGTSDRPKSYEELIGSTETPETKTAETSQEERFTQPYALRTWEDAFKKQSLASIIEDGLGEGALVCHLAADEEWMALERKGDAHMDALREISKNPEVPEKLRVKIYEARVRTSKRVRRRKDTSSQCHVQPVGRLLSSAGALPFRRAGSLS